MFANKELQPKDWFLPGIFVLVVLLLIATVLWRSQSEYLNRHRNVLDFLAKQAAVTIASDLQGSEDYLQLLADAVGEHNMPEEALQERAREYVQKHSALISIFWADSGRNIIWAVPGALNTPEVGLRLDRPEQRQAVQAALQSGQPEYTRPFNLLQGLPGFEVYVPVFSGEQFIGIFGGVFAARNLLQHVTPASEVVGDHVHLALVTGTGGILAEQVEGAPVPSDCVVLEPLSPLGTGVELRVSDDHFYYLFEWSLIGLVGVGFGLALLISLRKLNHQMMLCQSAEQLAAQNEARLRSLFQAVQAGILLQDVSGKILHVNRPACDILKMTAEEIIGKSFIDLDWQMSDEDGNFLEDEERPATLTMRTGQPQEDIVRGLFVGDLQKRIWLSISTHPIVDSATGALTEVLITFHDITKARDLQKNLEYLTVHDALTGLLNRRFVEEEVVKEIARAERYRDSLSFLMIDIDHFKQINDRYGHKIGDQALCMLARQLSKKIRDSDYLARYGGEEFLLILPDTSAGQAWSLAEKLRQQVEVASFASVGIEQLTMTISIGVASFPEHGEDWETLFKAADAALYLAKQRGRNQVVITEK